MRKLRLACSFFIAVFSFWIAKSQLLSEQKLITKPSNAFTSSTEIAERTSQPKIRHTTQAARDSKKRGFISNALDKNNLNDIQDAISDLEKQLKDEESIAYLNNGALDNESREEIAKHLQALDDLRTRKLELLLADLDFQVASLEQAHASRLKAYGVQR